LWNGEGKARVRDRVGGKQGGSIRCREFVKSELSELCIENEKNERRKKKRHKQNKQTKQTKQTNRNTQTNTK